jgi:hypothetical protein
MARTRTWWSFCVIPKVIPGHQVLIFTNICKYFLVSAWIMSKRVPEDMYSSGPLSRLAHKWNTPFFFRGTHFMPNKEPHRIKEVRLHISPTEWRQELEYFGRYRSRTEGQKFEPKIFREHPLRWPARVLASFMRMFLDKRLLSRQCLTCCRYVRDFNASHASRSSVRICVEKNYHVCVFSLLHPLVW